MWITNIKYSLLMINPCEWCAFKTWSTWIPSNLLIFINVSLIPMVMTSKYFKKLHQIFTRHTTLALHVNMTRSIPWTLVSLKNHTKMPSSIKIINRFSTKETIRGLGIIVMHVIHFSIDAPRARLGKGNITIWGKENEGTVWIWRRKTKVIM